MFEMVSVANNRVWQHIKMLYFAILFQRIHQTVAALSEKRTKTTLTRIVFYLIVAERQEELAFAFQMVSSRYLYRFVYRNDFVAWLVKSP